jgi:UDP-2-acetamido-2-deoxy-ribo-hexuluronate aminotransferase
MFMKFIDLAAQQRRIRKKIEENIFKVLDHGQYIMGPEVKELEEKLGEFVGVRHAISCASGTDALILALLAKGIGPGDAILTTPFTFIATAEVISLLGAVPVFVDIDPETFNIDPDKLEQAINALRSNDSSLHPLPSVLSPQSSKLSPKGIIPVDLFGLPADFDPINRIADQHGLFVIEDAAQSFGAEYYEEKACSLCEIACTSFFPAKPFGCYGDGGMCFTNDDSIHEIMTSLRVHGQGPHKYENVRIGINGRFDTMQAAILLAKFEILPEEIALRQKIAQQYSELLADCSSIKTPSIPDGMRSAWAQYSLLAENEAHRSDIQLRLKEADVPTAIYYPKPLHLQKAFVPLGYNEGDFPISEDYAKRIFSIPMHPYLALEDQKRISDLISCR